MPTMSSQVRRALGDCGRMMGSQHGIWSRAKALYVHQIKKEQTTVPVISLPRNNHGGSPVGAYVYGIDESEAGGSSW